MRQGRSSRAGRCGHSNAEGRSPYRRWNRPQRPRRLHAIKIATGSQGSHGQTKTLVILSRAVTQRSGVTAESKDRYQRRSSGGFPKKFLSTLSSNNLTIGNVNLWLQLNSKREARNSKRT